MRSMSQSGNVLTRSVVAAVLFVLLIWGITSCIESEEEQVAREVERARAALVEGRPDEFLEFFAEDVDYQSGQGREQLAQDLARWQRSGKLQIYIRETEITLAEDGATVAFIAHAGLNLLQTLPVSVKLTLRKRDDRYQVVLFRWSRN